MVKKVSARHHYVVRNLAPEACLLRCTGSINLKSKLGTKFVNKTPSGPIMTGEITNELCSYQHALKEPQ